MKGVGPGKKSSMETKHVGCCLASGPKAKDNASEIGWILDEGMSGGGGSPAGRGALTKHRSRRGR